VGVGHKDKFLSSFSVRQNLYSNLTVKNPDVIAISLGEEIQMTVAF
jgi:hypothetical protein